MSDTLALPETLTAPPFDRWGEWVEMSDGTRARAKLAPDYDSRLEDSDYFGALHWPERHNHQRPAECNGAARKFDTRDGPVWWQPPADVLSDAELLKSLERHVRGYFREEWSYVGVCVEVESAPCGSCGERKRGSASLWRIESNSDSEYFAEVVRSLIDEAQ